MERSGHCKKANAQIKCVICSQTFCSRFLFALHKLKIVGEMRERLGEGEDNLSRQKKRKAITVLVNFQTDLQSECILCDRVFVYKRGLVRHLISHHGMFCGLIWQLKCKQCGQIFCSRFRYDAHVRRAYLNKIKLAQ